MLKNHCIVEYYKYDINIIKPIQFICHLAYDILLVMNKSHTVKDLFSQSFINTTLIDFDNLPKNVTGKDAVSWLADQIAIYYLRSVLDRIELKDTRILFLHKSSKIIYVLNKGNRAIDSRERESNVSKKENIRHNLLRLIRESGLLTDITKEIENSNVRACIENSLVIDNDAIYNESILVEDVDIQFDVPYFHKSFLDSALITEDFIDPSDVWVNRDKFKKELSIEIGIDNNVALIQSNKGEYIGVSYNDYVFPIKPSIGNLIEDNKRADFYWIQIKEVFKASDNKKNHLSPLILDFKSQIQKKAFTNLLSNLKENLYLNSNFLEKSENLLFKKFFTPSIKIDEVKYLKKLNFFINDSDNPASFGIYSFEKLAEDASHFNLIHWFDQSDDGNNYRYRDNLGPQKTNNVSKVNTLKPEIAFYFITKYFEDFVQKILEKLGLEYLNNFHLYNGVNPLGEFDFLVKSSNTFSFIEVKTTLSKFYINDYISKCRKVIQAFKGIDVNLEFIIIGAYSNSTVEDLKHYISRSHKGYKNYNNQIENSATIPYYFNVPIETTDKSMLCIAESNFSRLKSLLLKCLK